jgi:hypothetical protein
MHAALLGDRAFEHPRRQRHVGSALPAAMSSCTHSATCFQPAACQPSNGPSFQPKPQRIARSTSRVVGDRLEVHGDVVEHVAEDRPQELRLRMVDSRSSFRRSAGGRFRMRPTVSSALAPEST